LEQQMSGPNAHTQDALDEETGMDDHHSNNSNPQADEAIPSKPDIEQVAQANAPALEDPPDTREESGSAPNQRETEEAALHQLPETDSATRVDSDEEPAADTIQPAPPGLRWRWTRRQSLIAVGVAAGILAIGGGTTLALLAHPSSPGAAQAVPSTATPAQTPLPTPATPLPLDQALQAWRTKHLTATRTQRFRHRQGSAQVPLGVVEPTYPNPYNLYHGHVQGYLLGGTVVATNQLFFYLGLESLDGSQFVGKFRVGPIDQSADHFGLLVNQQSTDDIEGGAADDPLVTLPPKAFYQALSALVGHCIVVDCIRQPLPARASDVPQDMLLAINQQAKISDQFLQVDYEAIHHTPLGHISASKLAPIRPLIDPSPITYTSAEDGAKYPLVTQVILRYTDQLFSKLVSNG
jgi:hypothetical protein